MRFEIRAGRPDEFATLVEVTTRAFGKPKDFFTTHYVHSYPDPAAARACVVAFSRGRIAGLINQTPMLLRVGRTVLKACGIGGVCALPEYRGQGVMSSLLEASNAWQRREGTVLGVLWGRRERYRRYGYENAGQRLLLTVSDRNLADARPVPLRSAKPGDAAFLARLSRAAPIGVYRTTEWQELLLRRTNFHAHCNRGGKARAFLVVEEGNPKTVVELIGAFGAARGLLRTYMKKAHLDHVQVMAYPGTAFGDWATRLAEPWSISLTYSGHVAIYDFGRFLKTAAPELAARFHAFGLISAVRLRHRDEGTCYELRPRGARRLDVLPVRGRGDLDLTAAEWVRTFFPPPGGPVLSKKANPRLLKALELGLLVPYWDRV
jgi:predicted N-acetyltransferase YhbS